MGGWIRASSHEGAGSKFKFGVKIKYELVDEFLLGKSQSICRRFIAGDF
jgi:hypothetical protein